MNETRFRDLERLYERAGKPRWPWWWYGVGVVLCVLALILILCSGPGKARAEDRVDPFDSVSIANAEVCAAMRAELWQLVDAAVQLGSGQMQLALRRAGMPMTDIKAVVDKANEPGAKAQAWFLWGPRFVPHQEAILLAFGCAETAD